MEIPYEKLQEDTLHRMIKEFVLREGTDYSHHDYSVEDKIKHVMKQLKEGVALIVYDMEEETFNIIIKTDLSMGRRDGNS